MSDDKQTTGAGDPRAGYAYPADLARLVLDRWSDFHEPTAGGPATGDAALPDAATLQEFFSACYQASMLRDEERTVTFRAILAEPALFGPDGRPPEGLQRLEFSRPLQFRPEELRRLAIAAEPQRTLIGVGWGDDGMRIWGLINSGARWLRDVRGGRRAGAPLPLAPVVHVDAAGRLAAYRGDTLIGRLQGGELSGPRVDVFESQWLPEMFIPFRDDLVARHEAARQPRETWAPLDADLPRRITERMHKRVISLLRDAHHGGTLLFLPVDSTEDASHDVPNIDYRYPFALDRPRSCLPDLIVDILNRLACLHGGAEPHRTAPVTWQEFESSTDHELATLDEALFEMAHLFAGLAAVDGALVISKHHELLGFGGMISGRLPDVATVCRALDLEGEETVEEEIGNVGARHRAAYRLVAAFPEALAIVISQDGGVRFVVQRDGHVTYWEQE